MHIGRGYRVGGRAQARCDHHAKAKWNEGRGTAGSSRRMTTSRRRRHDCSPGPRRAARQRPMARLPVGQPRDRRARPVSLRRGRRGSRHHAGRRRSEHPRVFTLPGSRDRDRGLHRDRATRARLALPYMAPEQRLCTRHARVRGLERSPLRSRHGALRTSRPALGRRRQGSSVSSQLDREDIGQWIKH